MRARNIKPSICDNELLGTADIHFTVLFERLWMMADREGRLEDRPLRIKAKAFAYRDGVDVEPMLRWLDDNDFIHRYVVEELSFIQVIKFLEHQKPHQNEKDSVIPAPPARKRKTSSTTKVASEHNQGSKDLALNPSSLNPESGILNPERLMDSPNPSGHPKRRPKVRDEPSEFVELRKDYPKRAGSQRWDDALGSFRARVREGVAPELILAGVRRYAVFIRVLGKEHTEHVQQAATFLGKNRGFELPWAPPAKPETAGDRLVRSLNGDDSQVIEHEHAYPAITSR